MPTLPTDEGHENRRDLADDEKTLDAALKLLRREVDANVGPDASFAEREAETLRLLGLLEEKPKPS